jgi:hypothetical protein
MKKVLYSTLRQKQRKYFLVNGILAFDEMLVVVE